VVFCAALNPVKSINAILSSIDRRSFGRRRAKYSRQNAAT
jgi:hypothetical protein